MNKVHFLVQVPSVTPAMGGGLEACEIGTKNIHLKSSMSF